MDYANKPCADLAELEHLSVTKFPDVVIPEEKELLFTLLAKTWVFPYLTHPGLMSRVLKAFKVGSIRCIEGGSCVLEFIWFGG